MTTTLHDTGEDERLVPRMPFGRRSPEEPYADETPPIPSDRVIPPFVVGRIEELRSGDELADHRRMRFEAGALEFQRLLDESDRLERSLAEARSRIGRLEVEVDLKDAEMTRLVGRVAQVEVERDRVRSDLAQAQTVLFSLKVQLDAFLALPKVEGGDAEG